MIVGLGGGIGASRVWRPLARTVGEEHLTLVVNTGDDLWLHGLRICPDLDTTLYALSGRQDSQRGWGLRDETFRAMAALGDLGEPVWFHLGDGDLATHLLRTGRLAAGAGLTAITRELARAMGVAATVLPMCEQEVPTRVMTASGEALHYQQFLVQRHAEPALEGVEYAGAERARPAPGVLDAIAAADLVVIAPSNPLASIAPVLAVPGIRDALRGTAARVVAVTPIVAGVAITDPGERGRARSRETLLATAGLPATATSAARLLWDVCDTFVLDVADAGEAAAIEALGLDVVLARTLPGGDLVEVLLSVQQRRSAVSDDSAVVQRWLRRLAERVGMSETERKEHHDSLLVFCEARDTDPQALLRNWQDYPELTVRRAPRAGGVSTQPAVESFLIHNGVNIFGDLVCMPRTADQLRQQGERFASP